jgi:hypothetical protein
MKLFEAIAISVLVLSSLISAQPASSDSAFQAYSKEALLIQTSFWSGPYLVRDNDQIRIKPFGKNLLDITHNTESCRNEILNYRSNRVAYAVICGVSVLSLAMFPVSVAAGMPYWTRPSFFGLGLCGLGISIGVDCASVNHLFKIVWLYNRDVTAGKISPSGPSIHEAQ